MFIGYPKTKNVKLIINSDEQNRFWFAVLAVHLLQNHDQIFKTWPRSRPITIQICTFSNHFFTLILPIYSITSTKIFISKAFK